MTTYPSGISFPFRFVPAGGVGKDDNGDKVISNLKALVLSSVNERLVRKAVGTTGYTRLFRSAYGTTLDPIKQLIKQAIIKYEPRASGIIVNIRKEEESGDSRVIADVSFIFRNTGDPATLSLELT